jgi:zinc/manganese transport system permease protein
VGFVVLLGVVAAEATQAIGALLLLGLLTGPAAAAHRLTRSPFAGIALAGLLGVGSMWGGLALGYAVPSLPPSTAIVTLAVGCYAAAATAGAWARRRARAPVGPGEASPLTAGAGATRIAG